MSKLESHPDAATLCLFHDGEGPVEMRRVIDEHVSGCSRCQEELAQLRTISETLSRLPDVKAPSSIVAGVRGRLQRPGAPPFPRWAAGLAAVLLFSVIVALWPQMMAWFGLADPARRLAHRDVAAPAPDVASGSAGPTPTRETGEAHSQLDELEDEPILEEPRQQAIGGAEPDLDAELAAAGRKSATEAFDDAPGRLSDRGTGVLAPGVRVVPDAPGASSGGEIRFFRLETGELDPETVQTLARELSEAMDPLDANTVKVEDRGELDAEIVRRSGALPLEATHLTLELEVPRDRLEALLRTALRWEREWLAKGPPSAGGSGKAAKPAPPLAPEAAQKKTSLPAGAQAAKGAEGREGEASRVRLRILLVPPRPAPTPERKNP